MLFRSSGMFTSSSNESGDLCGGMLRCVVWWRFRQEEVAKGWKREEAEETRNFCLTRSGSNLGFKQAVLFSGFAICGRWWRFGVKEAEEAEVKA